MAKLRLEIATLSAEKTAQDAVAADVVRAFARATGAADGATNQQLLNHALSELVQYMVRVARDRIRADAVAAVEGEAEALTF